MLRKQTFRRRRGIMSAAHWTAERVETLKLLWAGGATAQAIAAQLGGVSRSAIMGKVFRLRLERAGSAPKPASATRPRDEPGKSLLQLTKQSCRWPIGEPGAPDFHFCGAPGADLERGMPYCADHARLAYGAAAPGSESNNATAPDDDSHPVSPAAPARAPGRSSIRCGLVRRPAARRR
jgi:GcrA cell cycle regulator